MDLGFDLFKVSVLFCFLYSLSRVIGDTGGQLFSREECDAFGFDSEALKCSTCKKIAAIIRDTSLEDNLISNQCLGCCKEDSSPLLNDISSKKIYTSAKIYLDRWYSKSYPEIEKFLNMKDEFDFEDQIKVVNDRKGNVSCISTLAPFSFIAFRPYLVLREKGTKHKERIAIAKWQADEILEFLQSLSFE